MTRTTTLVTCLAVLGFAATAEAHFKLNAPAAYSQQSAQYGDPQKTAPCGPSAGTLVPTNAVTAVQSGAMLTISINETIPHPGHYRVALAQNMAGLPPAPPVANANCNGLVPNANPQLPVLADGLLPHTAPFSNPNQTMQVMIPAGMTCTNCVLQVLEYMANHAQPCFYYHCAMVNISPTAPPPPPPPTDGGIDPGGDAGMNPNGPGDSSGGCSTSHGSAASGLLGALVVGLALRRPRRRR
jgi:MYXO-CTERM domain-containing protein